MKRPAAKGVFCAEVEADNAREAEFTGVNEHRSPLSNDEISQQTNFRSRSKVDQVLLGVEKLFNAYLRLDPEVRDSLSALSGKVIELIFFSTQKSFHCYCCITPVAIHLQAQAPERVDVTLEASLLNYIQLAIKQDTRATDLRIRGDLEVAQQFQSLFRKLSIDWEGQLANVVGDSAAHLAMQVLACLVRWARETQNNLGLDLSEYLQEELQLTPAMLEVEDFLTDIDRLRDDVDRLEARLKRLYHHPQSSVSLIR